ncbi:hypothetical protein [Mesorhizobium retamae]|uniref:Uncharacterized protein n=1 Tax=Mesorhizobium retamae TaxID=2912854 RepID=A0ABS9QNK6_9HYPH|nr:hypothetical protein [Mesorhizobium sp. IRAMC:0171]MCG7509036.1 hypothetical protein [Mesorhizobium sp. IRAMC:0171]
MASGSGWPTSAVAAASGPTTRILQKRQELDVLQQAAHDYRTRDRRDAVLRENQGRRP